MKSYIRIISSLFILFYSISLQAQTINIPDAGFKKFLISKGIDLNSDGEIQENEALAIKTLSFDDNTFEITDFTGFEEFKNLEYLKINSYDINDLDYLSFNILLPSLKSLTVINFQLMANPNASNYPSLEYLEVNYCSMDSLVITNYPNLKTAKIEDCEIMNILKIYDLPNLEEILGSNIYIKNIFISNLIKLNKLDPITNDITLNDVTLNQLPLLEQINFENIFCNNLTINDLENLSFLGIDGYYESLNSINNLTINDLPTLNNLMISNTSTKKLNLSDFIKLKDIYIFGSIIDTITISNLPKCDSITILENEIKELNLFNFPKIETLDFFDNQINQLSLTDFQSLTTLYAMNNGTSILTLDNIPNLSYLELSQNQLSELNLNEFPNLTKLNCSANYLKNIDLSKVPKLEELIACDNPFEILNISNLPLLEKIDFYCYNYRYASPEQYSLNSLTLTNLPSLASVECGEFYKLDNLNLNNLSSGIPRFDSYDGDTYFRKIKYICTDSALVEEVKERFNSNEYPNTLISLCNSTADGSFYKLTGNTILDVDNNGCDVSDIAFPFLKIKMTGSLDTGYLISGNDGNYSLYSQVDTVSFQPILDQPNYYNIDPEFATYTFPDSTTPSFCISPNGIHNDLTVAIIPVIAARPGFSDATYKVVYKNQGTTTQSGSVTFNYAENKMDFISSTPIADNTSYGNVSFDFSNLKPFETRSALITMRTNAPTDNPAVNSGDVLEFTAAIIGATDETPDDNLATLNQTVVGSFDPNDKTCLEGEIVSPTLIGKNVHYLIRFENTGTANAENIVVTDYIDTTVFEISTLQITDASHTCHTQISQGNKVQFIFSDIQLPFTEPDKHGYVAFSIKLKGDLVIGDSIKNKADIFFDYNLPVETNIASAEINYKTVTYIGRNQTLKGFLDIYPNPSNGQFSLELKANIKAPVQISILNVEGKVIFAKSLNHQNQSNLSLDLKHLAKGVYFIQAQINNDIISKKVVIQ